MQLGKTILRCEPFAYVVSKEVHGRVCDFCLKAGKSLSRCGGCKYVHYCATACQRPAWKDHRDECKYLKEVGKIPTDTVRLMARVILKLQSGGGRVSALLPDGSHRRFDDLMSHTKNIIQDSQRLEAFNAFFAVLRDCFKDSVPQKQEVLDLYGRILINSFNIMDEEYRAIGVGLYLEASVLDHSCRPNATVTFCGKTLAVRPIVEDPNLPFADVRIAYTSVLGTTATRRAALRQQYYFDCDCEQCLSDPDGVDPLKCNGVRCPKCEAALPAHKEASLQCTKCSKSIDLQASLALKARVEDDVVRSKQGQPESAHDEMVLCYAQEMLKAQFHPFDQTYLHVLEKAFEICLSKEEWSSALMMANEILVAYRGLYPKFDVNTALLLLKMGKLTNFLQQLEAAEKFLLEARDILVVTHGKDHPLLRDTLEDLLASVRAERSVTNGGC